MSSRPSRERSQPTSSQACAAVPWTRIVPDVGDPGPERGEQRPPARRPRPGDVRDRRAREAARRGAVRVRQVVPLGRVDDEPVGDADELVELLRAPGRLAAPAQEHRQVGDEQRLDDARGRLRARSPCRCSSTPREQTCRARRRAPGYAPSATVGVDPVEAGVRLRDEQDRARRVPLRHPVERRARPLQPRLGHPRDVRHHARAQVRRRPAARRLGAQPCRARRSTSASGRPRPSSLDSTGALSSVPAPRAAVAVEEVVGARRPPACRPRSSGSRAGRAATPRRSRRRAATAPRPRRRA